MIPKERRRAREWAMKALYQVDVANVKLVEAFQEAREPGWEKSEAYAKTLVEGVRDNRDEIDAMISRFAKGYSLDRVAAVDFAVLRLAIFEMVFGGEVPPAVAIDEAIELAKKYSTEQSGSFVNGILASVMTERGIGTQEEVQNG